MLTSHEFRRRFVTGKLDVPARLATINSDIVTSLRTARLARNAARAKRDRRARLYRSIGIVGESIIVGAMLLAAIVFFLFFFGAFVPALMP